MARAYEQYVQKNPRIEERYVSHSETAPQKVAIITIEGTILHSDGFAKWQIDQAAKDPDVKAVVVRVDSPGGTVTGSDYLYHHLKMLRGGKRWPKSSDRGEHGGHCSQRRILLIDGRRRRAEHDFRGANHLDRLDRRDHSAFHRGRFVGKLENSGRLGRQRSV